MKMSGKDERKVLNIPICPNCGGRPRFWTLCDSEQQALCVVFSKEYSLGGLGSGTTFGKTVSFAKKYKYVSEIEHKVMCAWCMDCKTFNEDVSFIQTFIDAVKKLEKTKYVNDDEWNR